MRLGGRHGAMVPSGAMMPFAKPPMDATRRSSEDLRGTTGRSGAAFSADRFVKNFSERNFVLVFVLDFFPFFLSSLAATHSQTSTPRISRSPSSVSDPRWLSECIAGAGDVFTSQSPTHTHTCGRMTPAPHFTDGAVLLCAMCHRLRARAHAKRSAPSAQRASTPSSPRPHARAQTM